MAKVRKKKRTHVPQNAANGASGKAGGGRSPKSMVIRMGAGDIGPSVSQLAKDFRSVMEPDTASRLKERKSNKLKDFLSMAGPLGVTHLFLFSRSDSGNTHLRLATTPRGPTITFRVEEYALRRDIANSHKHPRGGLADFPRAPLLVMNNFTSPETADFDPVKKQLESLTTTVFQSIFPPISPQTTSLSTIKRILLLNRESQEDGTFIISLRHYAITTRAMGVSKRIRKIDTAQKHAQSHKGNNLPNLGRLNDMADYLLDQSAGYATASDTELDTDNEIEVMETTTKKVLSRKEREKQATGDKKPKAKSTNREKRAVKLVEIGPRMRLRMIKVEEGICDGRVMWNEFVTKTKAEEKELDAKWSQKRKEKEERKKLQRENVERKKELKKNTKANAGTAGTQRNAELDDSDEAEEWDSDELGEARDQPQDEDEDDDENEDEKMED